MPDHKTSRQHLQADLLHAKDPYSCIIGADVIAYMIPERHPMIMVDRIINYSSSPLCLKAERYISANEPVFTGHFPDLKLWPGVHTLEGLRQSYCLLQVMHLLDEAGLIDGVIALQNRQTLKPKVNKELCQRVLAYLKEMVKPDPFLFKLRVKLLAPVFAGCKIKYFVKHSTQNKEIWTVEAEVEGRTIAKGSIIQSFDKQHKR